jgi:hypothetical protein
VGSRDRLRPRHRIEAPDAAAQSELGNGGDLVRHGFSALAFEHDVGFCGKEAIRPAGQRDHLDAVESGWRHSLLTTTEGRVFGISPPIAASNVSHQTSPRRGSPRVGHIADQGLAPFDRVPFSLFVCRHGPVTFLQGFVDHVRFGELVQESTDAASADHPVEAGVDLLVHRDCQLLSHRQLPIRIAHG